MDEVQDSLKQRHSHLHPLIFQRSVEKARSNGELFDILEEVSSMEMPVVWNEKDRKWMKSDDLLQGLDLKK